VHSLKTFRSLDGFYEADSLKDFFERLANILAVGVLNRFRRGIYRTYEPFAEDLTYVRGKVDFVRTFSRPGRIELPCDFEEHTADIEDNQLLSWTLQRILRSGLCSEKSLINVRAAYRHFQGVITPTPYPSQACLRRLYNRLNNDYRPLHALCYFFMSQTGPTHMHGQHTMLPFLVDMARLYEGYVAAWLQQHIPRGYAVRAQEHMVIDSATDLSFRIDLVIYDEAQESPRWVLDTKYKVPSNTAGNSDINQAVTYATAKGVDEAILIYPTPLPSPLDVQIGPVRVRSLTFALDGDLDAAGQAFLDRLFEKSLR
jgi:5-methylcytosine-specific restriction enzyme subunit McrC